MDGLGQFLSALPGLGSIGGYGVFAAVVVLAIRMLVKSDQRYNVEVDEHDKTQRALDEQRARRRQAEDDLAALKVEMRALTAEVIALRKEVAELKGLVGS